MKILRYLLAVAVMAVFAVGAQAQTAAEVATSVKKMESATALLGFIKEQAERALLCKF